MGDIKFFRRAEQSVNEIVGTAMRLEKDLQNLFEYGENLSVLMGISFLASEYKTTDGRIDTLGLDENKFPVIFEYKRDSHANIVTQGLYYLDWLMDHRADFEQLVKERLGETKADEIDWSSPRLVLVAADFNRYDIHAIKQIDRNIELIRYRKFEKEWMMLDLLTAVSTKTPTTAVQGRSLGPRKEHQDNIEQARGEQKKRYDGLREFLFGLGDDVQERHLKTYVAFRRIKNFACVELRNQKGHILVFVKGDKNDIERADDFIRDVSNIGHNGTGNIEITISSDDDLERAKPIIRKSYEAA